MINHAMKRIRALEDQLSDLAARVDKLEAAGSAAPQPSADSKPKKPAKAKTTKAGRQKQRVLPGG